MSRPVFSRPAVRRFLSQPGALVLFSALAVLFACVAWHIGCQSSGAVWSAAASVFFGLIAAGELRACITGIDFY